MKNYARSTSAFPEVSIVITTKNEEKNIGRCLEISLSDLLKRE